MTIRHKDGAVWRQATPHECEILIDAKMATMQKSRGKPYHVRLIRSEKTATACLRRALSASGRTVAEASQLTFKTRVPGGGVTYSHFMSRTNGYRPGLRAETP